MSAFIRVLCVLLVGGLMAACGKKEPPANYAKRSQNCEKEGPSEAEEPEPAILAAVGGDAAAVFKARCSTCHGIAGLGNGAAAAGLNPKPRSFADPAWQARSPTTISAKSSWAMCTAGWQERVDDR